MLSARERPADTTHASPVVARRLARLRAAVVGGMGAAQAACSGPQSALDPRGPAAAAIAETWWVMAIGATLVLALVMGLLLYTLLRRPREAAPGFVRWMVPVGGLAFPTVVLAALLVYGTRVGEHSRPIAGDGTLRIEVVGHQWWWEAVYPAVGDSAPVRTVNQVHIPAGRPVDLALTSSDVIHSFWVPSLAGKLDAIPGRTNVLRLSADAPGVYRGQCAEFCGLHHSRMAFRVIAHAPADYEAWLRTGADGSGG